MTLDYQWGHLAPAKLLWNSFVLDVCRKHHPIHFGLHDQSLMTENVRIAIWTKRQCMCVFRWLWDSVPWVEIMCGWVGVCVCLCLCVEVSPWFINVGFSTTWSHSSSSTHCNATGTYTCCPAQGQLGEDIDKTGLKQVLWLLLAFKQTQCALIDWLHSHMVFHASHDFKTIKSPAIYALICFDLSGGKGVSCFRETSSGTNTNAFVIHNLLASSCTELPTLLFRTAKKQIL